MALSVPHQWTAGTVPGDTEILTTPTTGNWLIAIVSWTTADNSNPTVSVGDWSRNIWTLLYSSTIHAWALGTQLYVQIYACPAVQYPGWPNLGVYAAFLPVNSSDDATVEVNVFEVAGMVNGYLTVDSVTRNTATSATTFSLTTPAPGANCLMVAAVSASVTSGVSFTGTGWNTLTALSNGSPNITQNAAWAESAAAKTASWSSTGACNWAGTVAAVRVTGTTPTQVNPNWPIVDMQLGLGYTLATPPPTVVYTSIPNRLSQVDHERGIQYELGLVQSSPTDLVLRNDDGALAPRAAGAATATGNGTTTTFVCSSTDAATVNVTDYFQLKTSGGGLKEFTVFQVTAIVIVGGTATITFTKANGTGGGALATTATGDLYAGTPIDIYVPYRILATWNGKVYPLVTGWIERWPQVWDNPHWGDSWAIGIDPIATLTAQDYSPLMGELLRRGPQSYWPLGDSTAASTAQNISGVGTAVLTQTTSTNGAGSGTATFGAATQNTSTGAPGTAGTSNASILGEPGSGWAVTGMTAAQVASDGFALVGSDTTFPPIGNGVTVCGVWFQPGGDATRPVVLSTIPTVMVLSNTTGAGFQGRTIKLSIQVGSGGAQGDPQVVVWDKTTGTATTFNISGVQFVDTAFMAWALTFNQTSWAAYVQGVSAGSGTANLVTNFDRIEVGGEAGPIFNGRCMNHMDAHIAIFPRRLSAGEIADINSAMQNGYLTSAFATDQTIARKLNTVQWKGPRVLNYTNTFNGVEILGSSIADKVTQLADYNADKMFCDAAGYLQFRARSRAVNQTSRATIGDRPDLGEIPFLGDSSNLEVDYDPTYIYNSVVIENDGIIAGAYNTQQTTTTVAAQNQTSIGKYGLRTLGKKVSFTSDTYTTAVASYYITEYSAPRLRLSQVVLEAASNNTVMTFVLGVEVGDLVTVNRRPIGAPAITMNCVVLDIKHSIAANNSGFKWETTLTLAPAPV